MGIKVSVRYFGIDYSDFLTTLVLGCHRDTWVYIQVVLGYQIDTWVLFSRQNCWLMSRNVKKMHFFCNFLVVFESCKYLFVESKRKNNYLY